MVKRSLLLFLIIFTSVSAAGLQAQQSDTATAEIRQPPADKLADYARDDAFNYRTNPQDSESVWDKIRYWLQQQIRKVISSPAGRTFLEIALYLGIGVLIFVVIRQFMKGNMRGLFLKSDQAKPETFRLNQQPLDNRNWDELIQEAIANNQFGLAVRYLYQKSLLQLKNNGIIHWRKDKTNRDYIYEINSDELRDVFAEVTRYYEYAEYGNFAINSSDFEKVQQRFQKMRTLIQSRT